MAKMFKKTFAMLLVLCMLVGMLPVQALAEEADVTAPEAAVTIDTTGETPVVEIDFTPGEDDPIVPEIESELTTGDGIAAEGEYTMTESTDAEGNTVITEEVTITTEGTLEDGSAVEGEETYTETTTTVTTETEETVTVESTLEGQETISQEDAAITPDDTDLPEVEVPVLPSDELFESEDATKDVVVEAEEENVKTGEYKGYDEVQSHYTSTTTTTENVTVTEQEKVEEENKTVETTTTTTIEKTTVENAEKDAFELRDGDKVIASQNVVETKDVDVSYETTVNVTETTKETVGDVQEGEDDTEYDYTEIETTIEREVTSEIEVEVEDNSSADMDQVIAPEDYEGKNYDNGTPALDGNHRHFEGLLDTTDPDCKEAGEKPAEEGYDFVLSGEGDATWAAAPVFKNIVYLRDENGDPIPDPENPGSYLIDEEKSSLVYAGEKAGNSGMNGTPGMIVVKNEEGELFYTYCIDKETPTADGSWYKVTNLEDSDYYPDDESAAMLRAIVTNGYWGTEEGTGSLSSIKELMRATYGEEDTVTVKDAKGVEHTYNIVELIDDLQEHEALAVTQSAIWSYSNGALETMNGKDGVAVVGVMSAVKYYNNNGKSPLNQYGQAYNLESDARLQALYDLFMNLTPMESDPEEVTTVINENNFVEDVFLTIGDKAEEAEANYDENEDNDVYETELNFTLAFVPDPTSDDLLVYLLDDQGNKITDKDGKPIIKRLAGENSEGEDHETITPDANGVYTLKGLQLSENSDFKFDLKLEGTQILKEGVYVYSSHGGRGASQTLVGLAAGTQNVDVAASMTISFEVDESKTVVATRHWRTESDPRVEAALDPQDPPTRYRYTAPETVIEEEPVPLADVPQTGDNSVIWFAMIMLAAAGLFVLNQSEKKCKA